MDGRTDLRRYLRMRGILDPERAVAIAHTTAVALGDAHQRGVVHRNIQPGNILLYYDGSKYLIEVTNSIPTNSEQMALGSWCYYASEQALGETVTPATDIYSLGATMYEMVAGRTPFGGDTPPEVAMQHIGNMPIPPSRFNPNVPPELEEVILRCLEKEPEKRFQNGDELAQALKRIFSSL